MQRGAMFRLAPGQIEWPLEDHEFHGILPKRKDWPADTELVPKAFVVPEEALSTPPCRTTLSKTGILSLPMEMLVAVLNSATNEDAICLAMTCKTLLLASTLAIKQRPSLPETNRISFRHFETETRTDTPAYLSRKTMIDFLLRLHPLGPGRQKAPTVSLCQDCLRYRPTDPRWWADKGAPSPEDSTMVRGWKAVVEGWRWRRMLQCPECWVSSHEAVAGYAARQEPGAWPYGAGALESLINTRPLLGYDWS